MLILGVESPEEKNTTSPLLSPVRAANQFRHADSAGAFQRLEITTVGDDIDGCQLFPLTQVIRMSIAIFALDPFPQRQRRATLHVNAMLHRAMSIALIYCSRARRATTTEIAVLRDWR